MRRTGKMKKLILATALAFTIVGTRPASAQDPTDEDIKLFRKDLRSMRKQIIAANMNLSDKEAEQFWPVFERYTQELVAKQDEKYALLKEYAQDYSTMTDAEAEKYIRGRASVDQAILEVRLKYFPLFRKVLSGKAAALFFQLDWRLGLLMDLQLASQTPVIEP
jgi:Spy/CpxP family protein refolding chaperone